MRIIKTGVKIKIKIITKITYSGILLFKFLNLQKYKVEIAKNSVIPSHLIIVAKAPIANAK